MIVWASLWTHLWISCWEGRKDLHISSTTCCGVREKCGTAGKEPKKKESPHEIERDIYIVLSLVLVWLWACVIHDQTTPFLKVLRVASRIPPNAKEMTKTKVLLISEKQWKTKTTMMTLNNTTNRFKFAKKINLRSFTNTTHMPYYFTWRVRLLTATMMLKNGKAG